MQIMARHPLSAFLAVLAVAHDERARPRASVCSSNLIGARLADLEPAHHLVGLAAWCHGVVVVGFDWVGGEIAGVEGRFVFLLSDCRTQLRGPVEAVAEGVEAAAAVAYPWRCDATVLLLG